MMVLILNPSLAPILTPILTLIIMLSLFTPRMSDTYYHLCTYILVSGYIYSAHSIEYCSKLSLDDTGSCRRII